MLEIRKRLMDDPPPPIPLADSNSDRQVKARKQRRDAKAKLATAKGILDAVDEIARRKNGGEKEGA